MRKTLGLLWLAALAASAGPGLAAQGPEPRAPDPAGRGRPVVVELFTSQGCSSCPPADALLEELAREPGLVAIARPVTYWDQLGWKDTLARQPNTDLQRAYARKGLGRAGVYTPQIIVQGGDGAVGSDRAEVRRLVARAKAGPGPRVLAGGGGITVSGGSGTGTVTLIAVTSAVDVRIGRGENGGRRIRYTNVVRAERALGRWTGGKQDFAIAPELLNTPGADRYAVIVQDGPAGPILAAQWL